MPLLESLRAKAGATLLDIIRPGWATEVSPKKLDLASCEVCVLGQLYGDFSVGAEKLFGMSSNGDKYNAAVRAGFDSDGGISFRRLTNAWKREIAARREA